MAESKSRKGDGDIKDAPEHGVAAVQSVTESMPAEADKSPLPNAMDAKTDDPPVRSGRPDVPIAQVLAAGAGEHTPADPDVYGPDGRLWPSDGDREAHKARLESGKSGEGIAHPEDK